MHPTQANTLLFLSHTPSIPSPSHSLFTPHYLPHATSSSTHFASQGNQHTPPSSPTPQTPTLITKRQLASATCSLPSIQNLTLLAFLRNNSRIKHGQGLWQRLHEIHPLHFQLCICGKYPHTLFCSLSMLSCILTHRCNNEKCHVFPFLSFTQAIGATLVGLGGYVLSQNKDLRQVLDSPDTTAILVIIVGLITFLVAFFGCCGASQESSCMLSTYAVIVGVVFLAEVALAIVLLLYSSEVKCRFLSLNNWL